MSYCRFENTTGDLAECIAATKELLRGQASPDDAISDRELQAAVRLAIQAQELLQELAEFCRVPAQDLEENHFTAAFTKASDFAKTGGEA